jgi:hypothetical protein
MMDDAVRPTAINRHVECIENDLGMERVAKVGT